MDYAELLQFVKPLLKASLHHLEAYILQKGTQYAGQYLPYPTGNILSSLVKLYQLSQVLEGYKEMVADDRGLWDSLKGNVANVTTGMANNAEFVKRLVPSGGGRKLQVEDNVNKMPVLISSIKVWFSQLIQRAKKMGMKLLVSLKTMATSVFSVGARFATRVFSSLCFF